MNPLLSRELRARFRDDRAFGVLFGLSAALSLFFAFLYGEAIQPEADLSAASLSGQEIFTRLSWMQTVGWLFIAPALTSSSIAYERERGWFDALLLSPLSPRAIVLGKWVSALLFAAVLALLTLPLLMVIFLLGGVTLRQFLLVGLLQGACAMCGAAIGIAASAWSPRAASALRTAYGVIFIGFCASLYGAATAGETPFGFPIVPGGGNAFWTFLGRTNPVLRSLEISGDLAFQRTGVCLGFLLALTLFSLWAATYYANRALAEAPLMQKRATKKGASGARATHGEIPFFSRIRFANPVLDREVRAKFRLRQPPLAVIVVEIVLGILVAGFYVRTLFWALFEPGYRETIWWGLSFTALIVSMMAASIMGSNGFSREREGGTWESVRLSLLSAPEILRGKTFASIFTCALFSLPVWPLLLPCLAWNADSANPASHGLITPAVGAGSLAIWMATVWSYTLIGLWIGRRASRTSRASGQTLGFLIGFLMLSPFFLSLLSPELNQWVLSLTNPLVALAKVAEGENATFSTLLFCAFQATSGIAIWGALQTAITAEINNDDPPR